MAGSSTFHLHMPHVHRSASRRAAVSLSWPNRVAGALMVLIGAVLIGVTFTANLYKAGPALDRQTDGFRPLMTQQAIQTSRQDLAALAAAGTEIQTKMLPALAQQFKVSTTQLQLLLGAQYPAVSTGLAALPTMTPKLQAVVNTLDANRSYFAATDAIPTKNMPSASVPWAILVAGLATIGLGVLAWFKPQMAAIGAVVVGVGLIAVPMMMSLPHKSDYADRLNNNLKPIYNQQLINDGKASIATLTAMGGEMQQKMLPALATQLGMSATQVQQFIAQNFPATAALMSNMQASIGRLQNQVATFDKHLADYKVTKPVSLLPVARTVIGGGVVLLVVGAAGLALSRTTKEEESA